jgi:uncharacterized Zn finger protein
MPAFSRTWWGQRFLAALEEFTDPARLGRGRSYARGGRVLQYTLTNSTITASVRGSINPYFGVYKEPLYETSISFKTISAGDWNKVLGQITTRADLVTKLLLGEMPETIEESFTRVGLHLLPHNQRDLVTSCSCPDYANPCKHIAAVYYLLAAELDEDPVVMFELRGISRTALQAELARSPLGQILAAALASTELPIEPVASYFTRPTREPTATVSRFKAFWTGAKRLPPPLVTASPTSVPALLIKKQGDYPPFWQKDVSFISVMEELYERVRTKSLHLKEPSLQGRESWE